MSKRRFEMYQYRQVLVRMRQGDADRDIERSGLMGRKKLSRLRKTAQGHGWLLPDRALPEDAELAAVFKSRPLPASCISSLADQRERIGQWAQAGVAGTAIHAALVRNHGYAGSYSAVRRLLQAIDAGTAPKPTCRLDFEPGEAAQVDFGAGPLITDVMTGASFKTWFFVMTLAWSRHQYAEFVRDQTVETWLACHRHAFEWFGGVVKRVIIDNPKCAITRACVRDPEVQRAYAECAEGYGFRISPCPPADPQKKGIVESGVKYVKRNFLPLREFRSLADANRHLADWVMGEAGNRCHGTTREKPLTRHATVEKALLLPLPTVPPVLSTWKKVTLHPDAHVKFGLCLYSAPHRLVGQDLWLRATHTSVQLFHEHQLVATHPRLCDPGKRSTVRDHLPPEAQAYLMNDPQWCLKEATRIGSACAALVEVLFADRVLDNLRAAQGIVRLAKTYGAQRLETACARALSFGNPRYRTVKTILAKGLDQQAEQHSFDTLAETYTRGGRFCRDTKSMLTH
jgi:transposase